MARTRSEADRLLDERVLGAERWRAAVLAAMCVVPIAGMVWGWAAASDSMQRLLPGPAPRLVTLAAFVAVFAAELRLFLRARERLRSGTSPPLVGRAVVGALEALLPTVVLAAFLRSGQDPRVILGLAPSAVYFLFVILSVSRLEPWVCASTGASATLGLAALVVWNIAGPDFWPQFGRVFVLAAASVLAVFVTRGVRRDVNHVSRMQTTFGQYVSPEVARKLLEQRGELPSEVRDVCVMFLDIRNFTSFAERRAPDEVVTFLNGVFAFMIDVVNEHHGVINKFLGDGFMAVFGAPTSDGHECENALAAARALIAELDRRVADGRLPPTRIGIGLHAGPAVTGNVGSETRREYTVIGDVVNLASRIESMNKELGSTLLLSGEVVAALPVKPATLMPRGPVKVKGREAPVELFQAA